MKFASIRDLRNKPGQIWRQLEEQEEMILTSNGKPIALLVPVDTGSLDQELRLYRQVRAQMSIDRMQQAAKKAGLDSMPQAEIEAIINDVRRNRENRT